MAEGYAEHVSGNEITVNNAPSNTVTPNESFHVEEEEEDDDCKQKSFTFCVPFLDISYSICFLLGLILSTLLNDLISC